jgi:NADH-ubiquinone oxidoreductase chain 2
MQLSKNKLNSPEKITIIFNIISLAGLPPFLGFSAKLLVLFKIIKILGAGILIILVISSLVSLFYYLKLFFNLLINNKTREIFNPQINISTHYNSIFLSVLINLFIPCILILT